MPQPNYLLPPTSSSSVVHPGLINILNPQSFTQILSWNPENHPKIFYCILTSKQAWSWLIPPVPTSHSQSSSPSFHHCRSPCLEHQVSPFFLFVLFRTYNYITCCFFYLHIINIFSYQQIQYLILQSIPSYWCILISWAFRWRLICFAFIWISYLTLCCPFHYPPPCSQVIFLRHKSDPMITYYVKRKKTTNLLSPVQKTLTHVAFSHPSFLFCHLLTHAFTPPPPEFVGLPERTLLSHMSTVSHKLFPFPRKCSPTHSHHWSLVNPYWYVSSA